VPNLVICVTVAAEQCRGRGRSCLKLRKMFALLICSTSLDCSRHSSQRRSPQIFAHKMSSTSTITTLDDLTQRYTTLKLKVSDEGKTQLTGPIQYNGSFERFKHYELTSVIGREYGSELQLKDLITADDATLRDFARLGTREAYCFYCSPGLTNAISP
jgi:hypothetical protein